jgi:hypothetical protein
VPEKLDDGLHVANIIADHLAIVPNDDEGPSIVPLAMRKFEA